MIYKLIASLSLLFFITISLALPGDQFQRPPDAVLKARLSAMQYYVTQKKGTETPYRNAYWDNEKPGIYVDVVSGEPLFSSLDKYDSKTGWPSFTKPLEPNNIVLREDKGWFGTNIEVVSKHAQSHLGHVFDDGPPPTNKRYCMNSAALKFIPVEDLVKYGYGKYAPLFSDVAKGNVPKSANTP